MSCGVYKIINNENGKVYIGSSKNLESRIRNHINSLKANNHHNNDMQKDFNIYGLKSFRLEIIEYVKDEKLLLECEQKWINELNLLESVNGYNKYNTQKRNNISNSVAIFKKESEILNKKVRNKINNEIYTIENACKVFKTFGCSIYYDCKNLMNIWEFV